MQTNLIPEVLATARGRQADAILRACVHCGFCTATCPTYRLLGDELDGPRGRIYLIKQALEGQPVSARSQLHLDRCLTCRACETTCPSGVQYGRLLDIGRDYVAKRTRRRWSERAVRAVLRGVLPFRWRFRIGYRVTQWLRPMLPPSLAVGIPASPVPAGDWPEPRHARRMLVLQGCVQPSLAPQINAAAARVLDRLGISLIEVPAAGCCGALSHHLGASAEALQFARRNIDAWWPYIESGAEAIVSTASGCGVMIKDYGHLLEDDRRYAETAAHVAALARDLAEVVASEELSGTSVDPTLRVAFQSPCTLQHGMKLNGVVENLLTRLGCTLVPVADAYLCCGSAGTYSILQSHLSHELRARKLATLEAAAPDCIVTANIGCLTHLQAVAKQPVKHWIELLDRL